MKLTQELITSKLSDLVIPQGECGLKAFEIAGILFDEPVNPFSGHTVSSVTDALVSISDAVANDRITIVWLDTGPMSPNNPNYRALHCYFVFDNDPLQCFSIWNSRGPVFYDGPHLTGKLVETIRLFGSVELHAVPFRTSDVLAV
jgi:hypothetical protein